MTLEKLNDSPPLNLNHSVKIKLGLNFVVGQDAGVEHFTDGSAKRLAHRAALSAQASFYNRRANETKRKKEFVVNLLYYV